MGHMNLNLEKLQAMLMLLVSRSYCLDRQAHSRQLSPIGLQDRTATALAEKEQPSQVPFLPKQVSSFIRKNVTSKHSSCQLWCPHPTTPLPSGSSSSINLGT